MPETTPRSIAHHFDSLDDPRRTRSVQHSLHDILVITLCALICGADSFTAIEEFARTKTTFLKRFLPLKGGIPSHDTIGRVFALLDPDHLAQCFADWMHGIAEATDGEVVALDGKRLRRSYDRHSGRAIVEIVGAWASENNLLLGALEPKTNEIETLPRLIGMLDLKGCIFTIDAAGCQRTVVEALRAQQAHYVLALKGNQGSLRDDVASLFERTRQQKPPQGASKVVDHGLSYAEETDAGHGRVEQRCCWALAIEERGLVDAGAWPGMCTVVQLERRRWVGDSETVQRAYYVSSLRAEASHLLRVIRQHWHVENRVHWVLDVAFGEDGSRVRSGHAAVNLGLVRRVAVSALHRETSVKRGMATKRLKAALDERYLLKVLKGL
ncbi:MAG: ISAs1-like element ISEc1 family transposase [Rhodothermales bacterium]